MTGQVEPSADLDSGRYRAATQDTIDTLIDLNISKRPNILVAGLAITAESAQTGFLINDLLPAAAEYVTYYANSLEEALSGAIRLIRHTSKVDIGRDPESWILVVDRDERLRRYFDPLAEGEHGALTQHVTFAASEAEALTVLPTRSWSGLVVLDPGGESAQVLSVAQQHNMMRVVAESRAFDEIDGGRQLPDADIFVFGENLTDFQSPFGSYSISQQAYRVWNNPLDAMAQTSTFAASATALTLVIANIRRHRHVSQSQEKILAEIYASRRVRNDYFRRFSNPSAADLMEAFGLDFDLTGADAGEITLRDGTMLLDCALGNGANLRGHNSPDIARELAAHDGHTDYTGLLAQLLTELSGFDEMLPAVSGATSVENALCLARLARPDKPRIVTFRGNFSGKTIATLNVSRYGPQRSASIDGAFQPYYPDVVFIDPFSADAAEELTAALDHPDVGLVWCELIQGMSCVAIPTELLKIVAAAKHRSGFLIGVDEVLTGVWRSAETFLLQQTWMPDIVDIVTIAKPLSDMMFPMAAALATSEVAEAARRTDAQAFTELQNRYRNNLGAHIAWHALRSVNTPESHARRMVERAALTDGLRRLTAHSPLYRSVEGYGAHLRLVTDSRYFPFRENTLMGELLGQAMEDLILRRCHVVLGRGRFFPPLFPPEGMMAEAVARLEHGFEGVTPATVYGTLVRCVGGLASFMVRRQLERLMFWRKRKEHDGAIKPA
ncbi:aminotransferase class III-fold pyridoxal phosphate-dependent enzyme [Mycobacterium sp. CBMA271]|uniref:aminotransferase class III-fold pyridoxal phosphate-dependent enzyme n=1 Tax=unclassified Mycobacteroides TaxID=2618759 RepID=UPI00132A41B0|nr:MULTISPECIES: aminotransferase class III-fold pyridoxal phosphate-dependent enzyme [unclassified Mycobacteroides]MUM19851.1 aminotransferase [Mycobacteroides sp. CBMA 326]MUM20992.1 aminotransferase class III-fold pyridoxal phosphate-dependent enzyme [Mycobacteroides sp. CBMA 271]